MALEEESERAMSMLRGKVVRRISRHREGEIAIEFEDGSRFFADSDSLLKLSVTLAQ